MSQILRALGNGEAFELMGLEGLRTAIEASVESAISCEVALQGTVTPGGECQGTVLLDGLPVPCDEENGYRLLDERTLELNGSSCEALRANLRTSLSARFPCTVFVPLI